MKGNIRGMSAIEKVRMLQDLVRENNVELMQILYQNSKTRLFLQNAEGISGHKSLCQNWMPPSGKSRDTLISINTEKFDILEVTKNKFCVQVNLMNITTKFQWDLMVIYGATQKEENSSFLTQANLLHQQKKSFGDGR